MKRDMDLIRKMVLAVRELDPGQELSHLDLGEVSDDVFAEHGHLLIEAGFAEGIYQPMLVGEAFCVLRRLTWNGQEFADSIESESVWRTVRERVAAVGSWTVPILQSLAADALKQQFGLPG